LFKLSKGGLKYKYTIKEHIAIAKDIFLEINNTFQINTLTYNIVYTYNIVSVKIWSSVQNVGVIIRLTVIFYVCHCFDVTILQINI